jgi:hypothetical protein
MVTFKMDVPAIAQPNTNLFGSRHHGDSGLPMVRVTTVRGPFNFDGDQQHYKCHQPANTEQLNEQGFHSESFPIAGFAAGCLSVAGVESGRVGCGSKRLATQCSCGMSPVE